MRQSIPILSCLLTAATAQCPSPSGNIRPSVASGYKLEVVATGLSRPRGLAIDGAGRLLVVQAGTGSITAHNIGVRNGCTVATDSNDVLKNRNLNHGIQMNGTVLYASTSDKLYSWNYDIATASTSDEQTLVAGMEGTDHSTRTIQVARRAPGMIVISRGSLENLDINATTLAGGTAQVKAFNLANHTSTNPYTWDNDGLLLAWGVRNEVGIAEHPTTGGIWGVENSADQVSRQGVDVSNDNPGEELNFFGYLNGTRYSDQGGYYGYPWCLAVWNKTELPRNQNLTVGDQFAFDRAASLANKNQTDAFCAGTVKPRLVFQAHQAPLDIKFNDSARDAWVTFHGSWNRRQPVGYSVSIVKFTAAGEPEQRADSMTAENVIVKNMDNSACPKDCLRPAAMAIDNRGRLFFSSDASGEIYMITRDAVANGSTGAGSSRPPNAAVGLRVSWEFWASVLLTAVAFLMV